ncbi:hypothetical protein ACS0TY_015345 [Phlomoides rotata]
MGDKKQKAHAIMMSLPFQGHINPFINLALDLASTGITITFVHLESVHRRLSKTHRETDFFSEARESGLDINYRTISDGLPLDFDRDLHVGAYWISLFQDFPALVDDFVGEMIRSDPNPIHFLVTDTVYVWPTTIARKYGLVNVCVWTQPALVFTVAYHRDLLIQKGHLPTKENEKVEIDYIPGVRSISTGDLMRAYRQLDHIMTKIFFTAINEAKKADFVLHNTVQEIEPETLSVLNNYQPNYAIGPLNFSRINSSIVSKSLRVESDCTTWLDSKPPGSVLYVSFGSISQASKVVIEEIAYGLLLSEVNFIWVARESMTGYSDADYNVLPSGFEDESNDRGMIIPWCDQIGVLSNPGIGGFLTHCGWNSIVESMWCGVPMICYPLSYDQPTNRKLVVDDLKVGVSLCDGASIDRNEVAEKIKSFMSGVVLERLRQEAKNVKGILRNALEIDGSSKRNFDQFVKDLKKKLCI